MPLNIKDPEIHQMARTLADIYDLQHRPDLSEEMVFNSPTSAAPVALSYIIPNTMNDLLRRRRALS